MDDAGVNLEGNVLCETDFCGLGVWLGWCTLQRCLTKKNKEKKHDPAADVEFGEDQTACEYQM